MEIQEILLMGEFPIIFGKQPRLPPSIEVQFLIKLEPGIVLIHQAPYRMALSKLKELKDQVQK